ncbi:T9SS type A sorting domain-containing protein [candidate division WOR-3 bacterium]|nr:T9SS type A sorting domain-containing protein [candidate division WOR-3 bacterium]
MKKALKAFVALAFCLSAVRASETALPVSKDSKVNEGNPMTTYGNEEFYTVWGGPLIIKDEKALLYFNGVDELRQAGYVCEFALLRLYITSMIAPAPANIFKIAGAWDEATVCWDNRPGEDHSIQVMKDLPSSQDVWFEVDVTNIVKSWMNEGEPNNGFYAGISEDVSTAGGCQFASGEFPDTTLRPRLFLEYYPGGGVEQQDMQDLSFNVSGITGRWADISFSLDASGFVSLKVYDARGSLIKTLSDGFSGSGDHEFVWKPEQAGVYFVKLSSGSNVIVRKFVSVR